jgi:hypothetical protein
MAEALDAARVAGSVECPYCLGENDGVPRIMSSGMGVESAAIQVEWFFNPASRDFCLCQLVILTAQTGDEHADTGRLMDKYLLPLYRYYMVRFVEVARGGEREQEGIRVLQDSRVARRVHIEGAYKLSDHLKRAGTVPQFGGEHRCSLKAKAFPCENWLTNLFDPSVHTAAQDVEETGGRSQQVRVAFGYNRDEQERADKSDAACERRNTVRVAFGFNADEQGRAERASNSDGERSCARMAFGYNRDEQERAARTSRHDTLVRVGFYPLIAWASAAQQFAATFSHHWLAFVPVIAGVGSRAWCERLLFETFGEEWQKSACIFCPFSREASKETEKGIDRFKRHPAQTADAMIVEYGSLCLNPRGALYNTKTLHSVVINSDQREAIERFEQALEALEFALVEVKRIYSAPGAAARSVIQIARGTRHEMGLAFDRHAERLGLAVKSERGIRYAYFAERREQYPAVEGFLVVAPAHIETKVRGKFEVFEERFALAAAHLNDAPPLTPGSAIIRERAGQPSLFPEGGHGAITGLVR